MGVCHTPRKYFDMQLLPELPLLLLPLAKTKKSTQIGSAHTQNIFATIFLQLRKGDSKYLVGPFNWGEAQQQGRAGMAGGQGVLLTVRYQLIWV